MRSKDGEFDLLFWRDATEDAQKEAESQQTIARLEEAGRSKTSFFSRMSHEIRTPMNGITGMLSLAEGKLSEDSPAMEYLHRADALAAHMLGLLNDILSISRIEANKVELEKKPLSLRRLGRAAAGNSASAIAPQLPESRCPGAGQAGGEGTLCRADCQGRAGWVGLEHGAAGRLAG